MMTSCVEKGGEKGVEAVFLLIDPVVRNNIMYCPLTKLTVLYTNHRWQRNPPHHPTFSTLLKDISLDQILISTIYSIMYLHFMSFFYFYFHDSGVGGGALLSRPKVFLLVDVWLTLLRHNINKS